jgi:hypothetical protein
MVASATNWDRPDRPEEFASANSWGPLTCRIRIGEFDFATLSRERSQKGRGCRRCDNLGSYRSSHPGRHHSARQQPHTAHRFGGDDWVRRGSGGVRRRPMRLACGCCCGCCCGPTRRPCPSGQRWSGRSRQSDAGHASARQQASRRADG